MNEEIDFEEDMSDLMNPHYVNRSDFIGDDNDNRKLFELIENQRLQINDMKLSMKTDAAVISVKIEVTLSLTL
jgi:hypothetical protein